MEPRRPAAGERPLLGGREIVDIVEMQDVHTPHQGLELDGLSDTPGTGGFLRFLLFVVFLRRGTVADGERERGDTVYRCDLDCIFDSCTPARYKENQSRSDSKQWH